MDDLGDEVLVQVCLPGKESGSFIPVQKGTSLLHVKEYLSTQLESRFYTDYSLEVNGQKLPDYSTFADAELKSHGNRVCMINSPYESERAIRYHIKLTSELLRRQPFILAENDKSIFPQVLSEPMIQADVKTSDKKSKSKPRKTETEKPNPYDMSIDSVLQQDVCAVSRADAEKTAPFVVIHDSPYNPPSGNRRMRGEMLYLSANFPDGQHVCVTCCVDGFFANRSTQQRFDPSPVQQGGVFATLMELLLQTNQSFRDRYTKAAANASTVYLMEYFSIPEAHRGPAWLTSSFRLPDDAADASRAEDHRYKHSTNGTVRDWNEEYQSSVDMKAQNSKQEQLRQGSLYQESYDFVEAATQAAIAVVDGDVVALNPGEHERSQIYLYNNIFVNYAVDYRDAYDHVGGDRTAFRMIKHDLHGHNIVKNLDVQTDLHTLLIAIIDYKGHRLYANSVVPGILHGEQSATLTHGADEPHNKFKVDESFSAGLKAIGDCLHWAKHAVIDGSGQRVEINSSLDIKGLIGSDKRKYLLELAQVFPKDVLWAQDQPTPSFHDPSLQMRPELIRDFVADAKNADADSPARHISFNLNAFGNRQVVPLDSSSDESSDPSTQSILDLGHFLRRKAIPNLLEPWQNAGNYPVDGAALTLAMHDKGINMRYLGRVAGAVQVLIDEAIANPKPLVEQLKHVACLRGIKSMLEEEMVARSAKHWLRFILRSMSRATRSRSLLDSLICFLNSLFGSHSLPFHADAMSAAHTKVTDELQRRLDLEKSDKECARNVMKQLQELSEVLKAPAESDSSPLLSLPVLSSLETISSQQVTELMSPTCVWAAIREFCQSKFRYDFGHLSWTSAGGLNDKVRLLRNICLKTGIRLVARPWPLDHSETPFTAADILDLKPVVSTSMPISPAAEQMFQDGSSRLKSHTQCVKWATEAIECNCSTLESIVANDSKTGLFDRCAQLHQQAADVIIGSSHQLITASKLMDGAVNIMNTRTGILNARIAAVISDMCEVSAYGGPIEDCADIAQRSQLILSRVLGNDHHTTIAAHARLGAILMAYSVEEADTKMKRRSEALGWQHLRRAVRILRAVAGVQHPLLHFTCVSAARLWSHMGHRSEAVALLDALIDELTHLPAFATDGNLKLIAARMHHEASLIYCRASDFADAGVRSKQRIALLSQLYAADASELRQAYYFSLVIELWMKTKGRGDAPENALVLRNAPLETMVRELICNLRADMTLPSVVLFGKSASADSSIDDSDHEDRGPDVEELRRQVERVVVQPASAPSAVSIPVAAEYRPYRIEDIDTFNALDQFAEDDSQADELKKKKKNKKKKASV